MLRVNRRCFIKLPPMALINPTRTAAFSTPEEHVLHLTDLDRQIWEEELAGFVPSKILDIHAHLPCWRFNLDPRKSASPPQEVGGPLFRETTIDLLTQCDQKLFPGRQIRYLVFPSVFSKCDFEGANRHVAKEVQTNAAAGGLMLVHPSMSDRQIERTLDAEGFLGFKCYRVYSVTGDSVECRITDFMPERQIAIADRRGLIIMLHLAKRKACADPQNLADLERLCSTYPRVSWVLAHCARSFAPFFIERAGHQLRELPRIWIDTSAVCESDSFSALFETFGTDRVLYGSDSPRVGMARGKYSSVGRGWFGVDAGVIRLKSPSVTDLRLTFYGYESLRALRYASRWAKLSNSQIQAIFHDNAQRLIEKVQAARV
jgi:glutamate-1-semialdehyde 2,1-aminomutase